MSRDQGCSYIYIILLPYLENLNNILTYCFSTLYSLQSVSCLFAAINVALMERLVEGRVMLRLASRLTQSPMDLELENGSHEVPVKKITVTYVY